MSKVVAIMFMSLDGYVADLNNEKNKRHGHSNGWPFCLRARGLIDILSPARIMALERALNRAAEIEYPLQGGVGAPIQVVPPPSTFFRVARVAGNGPASRRRASHGPSDWSTGSWRGDPGSRDPARYVCE